MFFPRNFIEYCFPLQKDDFIKHIEVFYLKFRKGAISSKKVEELLMRENELIIELEYSQQDCIKALLVETFMQSCYNLEHYFFASHPLNNPP